MAKWIKAELHFGSFCSYRIPGTSPQHALASPVPSPAALKLALVDAAIRYSGNIDAGRKVFQDVKNSRIEINLPQWVTIMRHFIKRLKPRGEQLVESTAIREYCHLSGALSIYIEVDDKLIDTVSMLFTKLRRLGTTDSLLWCSSTDIAEPDLTLSWIDLGTSAIPTGAGNFERRLVVTLNDIDEKATFDSLNPYSSKGERRLFSVAKMLPLVAKERAENWVRYKRKAFKFR
ncbi:MAG: hypothetical protein QME62_09555 [Armatimonadota bacterium]|nr:hypothetical protein [Armatimonadota bacterium]